MIAGFNYVKICDISSREFKNTTTTENKNNKNNNNRNKFLFMIHIHEYAEEEKRNERYGISFFQTY